MLEVGRKYRLYTVPMDGRFFIWEASVLSLP